MYTKNKYNHGNIDIALLREIVSGRTEYTSVPFETTVEFTCHSCGRLASIRYEKFRKRNFFDDSECLCKKCLTEKTNMAKYGVSYKQRLESEKEKAVLRNTEMYGCKSYTMTDDFKHKSRNTCLERYGVGYNLQRPEVHAAGVAASQSSDVLKKRASTVMEKYGVRNIIESYSVKDKIKRSFLDRYNVDSYMKTEEFRRKAVESMIGIYGVGYYNQTSESHSKRKTVIEYNGEKFDSVPEYDFYVKCLNDNRRVVRHPVRLSYIYGGKEHFYFPDFEVDGELVEIKGRHFYDPYSGKWTNPFNPDDAPRQAAKYDCAVMNNVKIIYV